MDRWAREHDEEVVIQTGYSAVQPEHCSWKPFFSYSEMLQYVQQADTVITHGGPSSFVMALQAGKTPIVVPRQARYREHVNDHQLDFCRSFTGRSDMILVAEEMDDLERLLARSPAERAIASVFPSHHDAFMQEFQKLADELTEDRT